MVPLPRADSGNHGVDISHISNGERPDEAPRLTSPFHSRVVFGEGVVYEMEGFTHGHHPQHPSGFDLTFTNPTQAPWLMDYCLLLVDQESVVKTLLRGSFELGPDNARSEGVESTWAHDLTPGSYGLVVVLPEHGAQYVT